MLFGCFGENSKQQSTVNKKSIIDSSNNAEIQSDTINQTRKKQKEFITNVPFTYKEIKKQYDNRWYNQFSPGKSILKELLLFHRNKLLLKMDSIVLINTILKVDSTNVIFDIIYDSEDYRIGILELIDLRYNILIDTLSYITGKINYFPNDTLNFSYTKLATKRTNNNCLLLLDKVKGIKRYKNKVAAYPNKKYLIDKYCVSIEDDKFLLRKANIN